MKTRNLKIYKLIFIKKDEMVQKEMLVNYKPNDFCFQDL